MGMELRPALAAMALAVLAAGCDTVPETAPPAQPVQSAPPAVATAATTTTASSDNSDDIECESDAATGSLIHRKCTTADQRKAAQQDFQTFVGDMKTGNALTPPGR